MNNIYLVSQDINNDYDTYDSMVVIAKNEDEARKTNPCGYYFYDEEWIDIIPNGIVTKEHGDQWVAAEDINKLKVRLIGTTENKYGVVLKSFNAG